MKRVMRLTIDCSGLSQGDLEELDVVTGQLRQELLEAEIESVERPPGDVAWPGTRMADPVTIGTLLVTLVASRGVLVTLLQTLQTWIKRHDKDSLTIQGKGGRKVKLTGRISVKDGEIAAWISEQLKS